MKMEDGKDEEASEGDATSVVPDVDATVRRLVRIALIAAWCGEAVLIYNFIPCLRVFLVTVLVRL